MKRVFFSLVIAGCLLFSPTLSIAQVYEPSEPGQPAASDGSGDLSKIESKIDSLSKKQDQILKTLGEIQSELNIVKIRISSRG